MPTGFTDSLTPVAQFIEWLQPERVLDVGVGGGRMGFLAREYACIPWHPNARGHRVVIDGIEGYAPYLGDLQRAIYDDLIVGEAVEILARMAEAERRYNLVIASDILEHFVREEAIAFLTHCVAVGTCVVVATPRKYFDQHERGNPLQTHRSYWPEHELLRFGGTAVLHRGASTVCLFGDASLASKYCRASNGLGGVSWRHWVLPPKWERVLRNLRVEMRLLRG